MQKILFINGHPNPEASVAGKAVLNALESSRCEMQIRTLAQLCGPNGFDVTTEQEALRRADVIVWHFPFYWYSVPAILKKWIDDVLTRGLPTAPEEQLYTEKSFFCRLRPVRRLRSMQRDVQ